MKFNSASFAVLSCILFVQEDAVVAFRSGAALLQVQPYSSPNLQGSKIRRYSSADDFSSFASSLDNDENAEKSAATKTRKWQDDMEELISLRTSPARRQKLLQQLLSANEEIRESVLQALRDGTIDPLLTPTGKKLQDGTKAVARQLSNDILPSLVPPSSTNRGLFSRLNIPPPPPLSPPPDLAKIGSRVFNAITNQLQENLNTFTEDLADPISRIPQRLQSQTEELVQEAQNVFAETPVGLKEPPYTVVAVSEDYEIRDYPAYEVASTIMSTTSSSMAEMGAAFNSLAAYLFGANADSKSMAMTTPVTTTMSGEMRFYLTTNNPPQPLDNDTNTIGVYETGRITLQTIPAARLAVRRFTGFCTAGEIARQKTALLAAIDLDAGVALDVPHGQTVGHVVFQYNPPYALPVIRRNEIAVPVVLAKDQEVTKSPAQAWD